MSKYVPMLKNCNCNLMCTLSFFFLIILFLKVQIIKIENVLQTSKTFLHSYTILKMKLMTFLIFIPDLPG